MQIYKLIEECLIFRSISISFLGDEQDGHEGIKKKARNEMVLILQHTPFHCHEYRIWEAVNGQRTLLPIDS